MSFSWAQKLERRVDRLRSQANALRHQARRIDFGWLPFPGSPQERAFHCQADELFFGGSAGCGKSEALLGLALMAHRNSVIYRKEAKQVKALVSRSRKLVGDRGRFNGSELIWTLADGRVIEFGGVKDESSRERYQGRPHDLVGFDEICHFSQSTYRFLIGWNRNDDDVQQRCRVVCTGNPPTTPEGRWVVEEWAPWLDPQYHDMAEPGELRWYSTDGDKTVWLKSGDPFDRKDDRTGKVEVVHPRSRTFIPGRVDDNPVLLAQGYKAVLQAYPEPLRSQMLYGDFTAGMTDDEWQVIPTDWVRQAQARWKPDGRGDAPLTCMGADPARGGACKTVLARRYGAWVAPLNKYPGSGTPDGPAVLNRIQQLLTAEGEAGGRATVHLDVVGIGAAVHDLLRQTKVNVSAFDSRKAAAHKDRSRTMGFANWRAAAWWAMREALDPQLGDGIMLPPDPELLSDLCAPRWKHTAHGIQLEEKADIAKRLGRSPDCGDAVVQALLQPRGAWKLEIF